MEPFGFVAFRSRQQTTAFLLSLKTAGVHGSIINTPHELGMGCGLSVKFALPDTAAVLSIVDRQRPGALIGVFSAQSVNGRLVCKPIARVQGRTNC